MTNVLQKCDEEIENNSLEIKRLENEMMEAKYKKSYLKISLKEFYFNFLAKEDEAIRFGRPYIYFIQSLWKLKETVNPGNLSKLFDQKAYEYFMEVKFKTHFL